MKPCRVCRVGSVPASRAAKKDWICRQCLNARAALQPTSALRKRLRAWLRNHPDVPAPLEGCTDAFVSRVVETHGLPAKAGGDLDKCAIVFDEFNNPVIILAAESKAHSQKIRAAKKKQRLQDQ